MSKSIIEQFGDVIKPLLDDEGVSLVAKETAKWVNERIEVAKEFLQQNNKNASRELTQSISPLPIVEEDGVLTIQVEANDYWDFVNSGVNGTEVQRGAPYSRKVSGGGDSKGYLLSIRDWMQFKGITTTEYFDKSGAKKIKQLDTEELRNGMAFGIMKAIKKKGQKSTPFMDVAFSDEALEDLEKRILKIWQ